MFLLSQGSPLETVDNMSHHDYLDVYEGMCAGLIGPYKEFYTSYATMCSIHSLTEVSIGVASAKKYKPKRPPSFGEMFSVIDEYSKLGRNIEDNGRLRMSSLKTLAVGADSVPDWVLQQMDG